MTKKRFLHRFRFLLPIAILALGAVWLSAAEKRGKNPAVTDTENGKTLTLPADLEDFLNAEFPGHRIPQESDFDGAMLSYFYSNLIGLHPAVAWGDFNGDKKRDYALLIIAGDTKWGPLVELVIVDGGKKGEFFVHRLGEIYNFKQDYLRFSDNKLYKGRFQKGGWHIDWDKKSKTYVTIKS